MNKQTTGLERDIKPILSYSPSIRRTRETESQLSCRESQLVSQQASHVREESPAGDDAEELGGVKV